MPQDATGGSGGKALQSPGPLPDLAELARIMRALGSPIRMELLQALQIPMGLAHIRVQPRRKDAGARQDRSVTRTTVKGHLERLLEVGAVRTVEDVQDGRRRTRYLLNHAQLFAITEELRALARLRPLDESLLDGTTFGPPPTEAETEGPRLVLVNGLHEGTAFPLAGDGPWRVGRSRECEACIDYDPYVSKVNAVVRRAGRRFVVRDAGSRNGTSVNWTAVPPGAEPALEPGDVLGVGRSGLVLRGG